MRKTMAMWMVLVMLWCVAESNSTAGSCLKRPACDLVASSNSAFVGTVLAKWYSVHEFDSVAVHRVMIVHTFRGPRDGTIVNVTSPAHTVVDFSEGDTCIFLVDSSFFAARCGGSTHIKYGVELLELLERSIHRVHGMLIVEALVADTATGVYRRMGGVPVLVANERDSIVAVTDPNGTASIDRLDTGVYTINLLPAMAFTPLDASDVIHIGTWGCGYVVQEVRRITRLGTLKLTTAPQVIDVYIDGWRSSAWDTVFVEIAIEDDPQVQLVRVSDWVTRIESIRGLTMRMRARCWHDGGIYLGPWHRLVYVDTGRVGASARSFGVTLPSFPE